MFKWNSSANEFVLANGLGGDPCLFVFFSQSGEGVLFDLGDLSQLSHKLLLKVKTICVSHTHIDHFIGFDRLVRVNIPHHRELEFCGPPGLAQNIHSKLKGYLWNLLEKDQMKFKVHEINQDGVIDSFFMSNTDQFCLHSLAQTPLSSRSFESPMPSAPAGTMTRLIDGSRIDAVALDHGTPSVAYLCQAPLRFAVRSEELSRLGLSPGPWIKELQVAAADLKHDQTFELGGKKWRCDELVAEVLTYVTPKNIGYITDIIFSEKNLDRIKSLMHQVDVLVCESNFNDQDRMKAFDKKHLTTKQAALIGASIGAEKLHIFHISKIYKNEFEDHLKEADRFFSEFKNLDEDQLAAACRGEFKP